MYSSGTRTSEANAPGNGMPGKLKQELRQTLPFKSIQAEAFLNILRTANALIRHVETVFRQFGISSAQYNVLRILRGVETGRSCSDISRRMVEKRPDITRLLDRLEKGGLIERIRHVTDRRTVIARLTGKGAAVVAALDEPVQALHSHQFANISESELAELIRSLEKIRAGIA
jgi:DNA-binding MarR family transcriptional regulator